MTTFTCHACGSSRPENLIAVLSRVHPIAGNGGATMSENIRYCVDRPACVERAPKITLLNDPLMQEPAGWKPELNLLQGGKELPGDKLDRWLRRLFRRR